MTRLSLRLLSSSLSRRFFVRTMSSSSMTPRLPHTDLTSNQFRDSKIIPAQIVKVDDLSPTVKGFVLRVNEEKRNSSSQFLAGQWLDLFIPGVEQVGGFSMCTEPQKLKETGYLDLAIKKSTWPPANWMHRNAKVGDYLSFRFGGDYHYPNDKIDVNSDHELILIGGGVGINPLASIIFHLARENFRIAAKLLFSAKTEDELLFKKKFDHLSETYRDFQVKYFVTAETDRRMNYTDLEQYIDCDKRQYFYICGPNEMIKRFEKDLRQEFQVEKDRIFYEIWW